MSCQHSSERSANEIDSRLGGHREGAEDEETVGQDAGAEESHGSEADFSQAETEKAANFW